jgi:glycosyltransferase involved in cell wall biosynthesis
MAFSIIVPWRNRQELTQTFPRLVETVEALCGELIVVNFGGSSDLLPAQRIFEASRVTLLEIRNQRYFNKAKANNVGAAVARHPILFFCDCDIIITPEVVSPLLKALIQNPSAFGTIAGVAESELNSRQAKNVVCFGYTLRLELANGRKLQIVDNEEDAATGTRQAPGLLFVRAAHFKEVNGYNGRLHGWGWEDQDMIARLTLGAGLSRLQSGVVVHLSHNDEARVAHYPRTASRWDSRDKMFRQALALYDNGDLAGTYDSDIGGLLGEAARQHQSRGPSTR